MLRVGSALLAGLLILSGCGSDKSAQADNEFRKACHLQNKIEKDIDPNLHYNTYRNLLEKYMIGAAKLDSNYLEYVNELYTEETLLGRPLFEAKCAVLN